MYIYNIYVLLVTFQKCSLGRASIYTYMWKQNKLSILSNLSQHVWELKNENKIPFIKRRILKKMYAKSRFNYCKLPLMEKVVYQQFHWERELIK